LADLKTSILELIRSQHKGKNRAITIAQIVWNERILWGDDAANERTVRKIIRQLNFEGYPILSSVHYPYGVYYAENKIEVDEYCANLGSRMKAILDRMRAIDKIRAREFLKGQMELFT